MQGIELKQDPIIKHDLVSVGKNVAKRIDDLNLDKIVATTETLKYYKETRAELNKEFLEYDTQRKSVKAAVNKPYSELDAVFKVEITERYKSADIKLKDAIGSVENTIKQDRKEKIESYFTELCEVEGVDFVKFEQVGIRINLSDSMKSYKEKCNDFVVRIKDDLALIDSDDNKVAILAEYKVNLNASKSIQTVRDRIKREREEKQRIETEAWNKVVRAFANISMTYREVEKVFMFNEDIYIGEAKVRELNDVELKDILSRFKAQIEEYLKPKEVVVPTPEQIKKPEVLKAPEKKEEPLEKLKAKFEVEGTMPELMALKQYLIDNNLNYKNI